MYVAVIATTHTVNILQKLLFSDAKMKHAMYGVLVNSYFLLSSKINEFNKFSNAIMTDTNV
jgi:hypothetical protein